MELYKKERFEMQIIQEISFTVADLSRRHTTDYGEWLDVPRDDRPGGNHGTVADRDSRQDDGPEANPHPVPDQDLPAPIRKIWDWGSCPSVRIAASGPMETSSPVLMGNLRPSNKQPKLMTLRSPSETFRPLRKR